MISTCPTCLNRVEHADDLRQVTCECGNPFSTFYEAPPDELTPAQNEPIFPESTNAFAEIRDFGEGLNESSAPKPHKAQAAVSDTPTIEETSSPGMETAPSPQVEQVGVSLDCLITAASEFPGYQIDQFLTPLSVWASLGSEDPLHPAFEALWTAAQKLGANGIVGVHWNLTSDKVLIAGTPVRLQKA